MHETVKLLERLYEDDQEWARWCERTAARFREVVDFDAEAEAIARMFEGVL